MEEEQQQRWKPHTHKPPEIVTSSCPACMNMVYGRQHLPVILSRQKLQDCRHLHPITLTTRMLILCGKTSRRETIYNTIAV
ncbi:hypothetical protein MTR_5g055450 [Medicago truncatula]|uniref:Uncharacterized protein n=1 Tax=Medicago truncatula TaxID=3880 RepID=G7JZH0_MEDTR|nr:hypothetical protein MTR_5g055450 [Medicago truncatula]